MQEESQSDPAPPVFDGPPPRPAPTALYSYLDYNPSISLLYIRGHQQANVELAKLGSGPQILGFDLEWKPNYRKGVPENPVALVQLSNHDTVFLLQISAMKEFPSQLAQVLANPSIVKAGVAIQGDARKLYSDCQIPMYNCVDLSLLARTVDNARWKGGYNNTLGLAHLTEIYEYRLLPKGKITRSNWEAVLDHRQIEYASNDAHAGYTLYKKFESMIPLLQDPPNPVWFSFNFVAGRLTNPDGLSWFPINPNYDPGPPPPPKVPKPPRQPKAADIIQIGTSQNGDFSNADQKGRNSQHNKLTSQVGRRDLEQGSYNTLPSYPRYTAYSERQRGFFDGSTTTSDTSSSIHVPKRDLPNRHRRYQQQRNTNNTGYGSRTTTTSSTLPTQTSHTQANGAFPTHNSPAQRPEQIATHTSGFPSGDSGGGNPRARIPFNSGARTNKPRTNSNRSRNDSQN